MKSTQETMLESLELSPRECWDLLRGAEIGRLAVIVAGRPEIFPVNYVVDGGTIVFRTADGSKLSGAMGAAPVAFEVDGADRDAGTAWSVVIKGSAEEVSQLDELIGTEQLPLTPWHRSPKPHFVRIVPDDLTGRRFRVAPVVTWASRFTGVRPAPAE
jgi:nitroimidazol reductase NimA-like FMN-containing flavoprotein (pyridoxamine 5'-phosphate oxidase superfamily)